MRIAIFDDGAGNVHSLDKVLATRGEVVHEREAAALCEADVVVLPGVGRLRHRDGQPRRRRGRPSRARSTAGSPASRSASASSCSSTGPRRASATGWACSRAWCSASPRDGSPTSAGRSCSASSEPTLEASGLTWGYYAHSFACPQNGIHRVTATSKIEHQPFRATLRHAGILGVQFHPEKSSAPGVAMVHAFLDEVAA